MTSTGVFRARAAWPHLERAPLRQRIEDLNSAYESSSSELSSRAASIWWLTRKQDV